MKYIYRSDELEYELFLLVIRNVMQNGPYLKWFLEYNSSSDSINFV
jgi:hypothetical protein